jgi:hypothetical protein
MTEASQLMFMLLVAFIPVGCESNRNDSTSPLVDSVSGEVAVRTQWSNEQSTFIVIAEGAKIRFQTVSGDAWTRLAGKEIEVDQYHAAEFDGGMVHVGSIDDGVDELTIWVENYDDAGLDSVTLHRAPKATEQGGAEQPR